MQNNIKNPHLLVRSGALTRYERRRMPWIDWRAVAEWVLYGTLALIGAMLSLA